MKYKKEINCCSQQKNKSAQHRLRHTTEIFLNLKENIHGLGYRCGQVITNLMENSL